MKNINLNVEVKVELTDAGRDILRSHVDEFLSSHPFGEDFYNANKQFMTAPLWEIAEIFGKSLFKGNPNPVFTSMLLEIVGSN